MVVKIRGFRKGKKCKVYRNGQFWSFMDAEMVVRGCMELLVRRCRYG